MKVDTEIRNIRHLAAGRHDCEINHPVYGWIPFTAAANDTTAYGRAIHAHIEELREVERKKVS